MVIWAVSRLAFQGIPGYGVGDRPRLSPAFFLPCKSHIILRQVPSHLDPASASQHQDISPSLGLVGLGNLWGVLPEF